MPDLFLATADDNVMNLAPEDQRLHRQRGDHRGDAAPALSRGQRPVIHR